ncbi:hypothetical protein FOMPIDRAFT_96835 [Fomitopsis schrenkii]|uniref:Uncharacterized protein n=1 Tax=Fomitopsis schrenkii TaxID=2126942 RepID=S8FGI0_FOMSC|nr:hypothetical protein FOMPIDRAFT_96835 [Fomitopsis schrenkii]
MSDAAENIFGVVASALGVIGIIPLVWVVIKCQLPVAKVKALEDILSDTKDFLLFVVEEGHMNDETFAYEVGRELDGYQERADELKIEAYRDDGYLSQLKGMVSGLSCRIYAIYRKVRKIRSKISRKAYENKKTRKIGIRSILPALRRASTGVVDDVEEKLDNVADSPREAQGASPDESDIPHDTRGPPAYCAILDEISRNTQYTEELQTNDEEAVPAGSTALDDVHTAQ